LAALGGVFGLRLGQCGLRRDGGSAAKLDDRTQHLAAITEDDSEVFQFLIGQVPKDRAKSIHTERHKKLCELLKARRKTTGLTQTVVAERLGKPPSFVAKYEGGDRRLDVLEFSAAMQQVSEWLEKLGLGQYAQSFAEADISFSVLPDLTDQDLKEIGVSLGHRRQLLREIANAGRTAAASPSDSSLTVSPIAAPTVTPPTEIAGERRYVTVMFCASTGISSLWVNRYRRRPDDMSASTQPV
jgi:transcriptional regulator with XRE-family HTH domain